MALGQTMPGPLAAQVSMWVGYLRRGALGAIAVAVAFVIPSFAIVVAVAALLVELRATHPPWAGSRTRHHVTV